MIQNIEYELIRSEDRIRRVDASKIDALVSSIKEVGLLNPITVAPAKVSSGSAMIDGYRVVAGSHRLAALMRMAFTEIPCRVLNLNDQQRVIAECDENLCVARLTTADEALFTARRKEAYEALHPETAHGSNQHTGRSRQLGDSSGKVERFTSNTAAATGQSERNVQRAAARGEKIIEAALYIVRGTELDKGTYLDKLKKVSPEKQVARVNADLSNLEAKKAAKAQGKSAAQVDDGGPEAPPAPERKSNPFLKMDHETLAEEHLNVLEENKELRAALKREKADHKHNIERLKVEKEQLASVDGLGPTVSRMQSQIAVLKNSVNDHQAATKREEYKRKAAERERDDALAKLKDQLIPL